MTYLDYTFPVLGRWLMDAGGDLARTPLYLARPESFPPELRDGLSPDYPSWALMVRHAIPHNGREFIRNTPLNNMGRYHIIMDAIDSMLKNVREVAVRRFGLQNRVPLPEPKFKFSDEPLPDKELRRCQSFRIVSRATISHKNDTFTNSAKIFRNNKTNVAIWTSLLLCYGEKIFLRKPSPDTEPDVDRIMEQHLLEGATIACTCARLRIFTVSEFRRFRRSWLRSHPDLAVAEA